MRDSPVPINTTMTSTFAGRVGSGARRLLGSTELAMGLLARQRAIEFGEEAAGLLWVSVEVVLNAGWSLARPWRRPWPGSGCGR